MIEVSKNIPMILYKYGNWENLFQKRVLTETEIYFASANQFNDPFDAMLPFVYDKSELTDKNILDKLITTSSNKHLSKSELIKEAKQKMKTTDFKSDAYWNEANDRLKAYLLKTFGIFSMTKNNDDILMWSHYANSHKGFCVGIDKNVLSTITWVQLKKIEYKRDFPIRPMFVKEKDNNKYLLKLITTKSNHWKYENEVRLISYKPKFPITMTSLLIKEIILGALMPEDHKKEIIELKKIKYPHAKLFQSELDRKTFKINIKEL